MASEVTICNLALGHLGDTANIASLTEASVQAQLCRKFYAPARDALLEMAAWGFATKRAVLAELTTTQVQWAHAYAMPSGVLNVLAVIPADAPDDLELSCGASPGRPWPEGYQSAAVPAAYVPQPYTIEIDDQGNQIILTNQCDALLRYTLKVTDPTKFSPLFTLALTYLLASMLAGPILKGDVGSAEAVRLLKIFQVMEAQAEVSDANQVNIKADVVVPWIAGRA